MNKFFDFSEHKEITTENVIDMSTNAIEYMNNLVEVYSYSFNNNLEKINSKFDTTNSLISNLREYGLNSQVASFIKSNYNSTTIDFLINDIDSLQYSNNFKLASEVANALEAINIKQWLNNLIQFIKDLWKKFVKFLKSLRSTHIALRLKIKQTFKMYDKFIKDNKNISISNVIYNHNNGLWKLSQMKLFVNEICVKVYGVINSSDKAIDIANGLTSFDEIQKHIDEYVKIINKLDDADTVIRNYNRTKKTKLAFADIALKDLTNEFYYIAFDAIRNMEKFTTFSDWFEKLYQQTEEFIIKNRIDNHTFTQQEITQLNTIVDYCRLITNYMFTIYKANKEIVVAYCNCLNNHPDFKQPTITEALLG